MPLIPPMLGAPSVTLSGTLPVYDGAAPTTLNSIASNYSTADVLELDMSGATGLTAYRPAIIYQSGSGGYLLVVADL